MTLIDTFFTIFISVMTIISVSMMGRFNKNAWYLGIFNQVISSIYYVSTGQYGFLIMTFSLTYFSVRNLLLWDQANRGRKR